jgi:hypothetical protein
LTYQAPYVSEHQPIGNVCELGLWQARLDGKAAELSEENAMDTQIITNLAKARAEHEKSLAALRQMEADIKANPVYQKLQNIVQLDAQYLAEADEVFRQEALSNYGIDGNKHKDCYDIAINKTVTIPDEGAAIRWSITNFTPALALRWSITNFTPALALRKKVFEDAVKAGSIPNELGFALDVPTVRIHSDLSEWLKGE